MRVSAGSALSYATMPGIFPRLKDILFSGFGPVTQLIAIICFMGGLLPKNHPCFRKETRDQYGLTRILAAAASGIEFKWKNIDKIIIFAMIVCGTVMMWLYLAGAVMFLLSSPSMAGTISQLFVTTSPDNDIAFMMLDRVLGIPGLFNSSVSLQGQFPTPFQSALHELFNFYSMAVFFVAFIIFLYHVVHLILQITQTGKVAEHMSDEVMEPYATSPSAGFSWLPIRFVMAFGLLIPFGLGLNSGQWITLYVAKIGSSLATNAWIGYNMATGENPTGENNIHLVAKPPVQDNSGLIKSLFLINSCRRITLLTEFNPEADQAYGYIVNGPKSKSLFNYTGEPGFMDKPAAPTNPPSFPPAGNYNATLETMAAGDMSDNFIQILDFSDYHDIKLVIGTFDPDEPDKYKQYPGKVLPTCGEITIPVTSLTGEGIFAAEGYFFAVIQTIFEVNRPKKAADASDPIEDMWLALMRDYLRTSGSVRSARARIPMDDAAFQASYGSDIALTGPITEPVYSSYWNTMMDKYFKYAFKVPPYTAYDFLADTDDAFMDSTVDPLDMYTHQTSAAFSALGKPNPLMMSTGILDYGWGGAGLWYNKVGERNGSLFAAAAAVPIINKYPMVMEQIKSQRAKTDTKTDGGYCEKFNPRKSGTSSINLQNEKNQFEIEQATALHSFCVELFENEAFSQDGVTRATPSTNPIEQAIHMFFSEYKIFDNDLNKEVTPMAQLTATGRVLIDKAILGVTASALSYAVGGAAHMTAGDNMQAMALGAGAIGDATMVIALLGLSSGFVLFYMLPMLPFVYFFFAVGRWVKTIFEALVGVPLWALAHMRVGGPGLPGEAAKDGYFMLLEIFIRPILTVFSLVAAYALFAALTAGLNSVFTLVSANLFGSFAPSVASLVGPDALSTAQKLSYTELTRGMIDQFFLTIFYIMLVYSIGIGCFKLIDLIPDNIMRWSGSGISTFGASDNSDDLIEEWQWQLPQRFNSATRSIGSTIKDTLYETGHRAGDKARQEAAHEKAVAAAKEKQKAQAEGPGKS